ncbi:MAG: hypothetical protein RRY07_08235, partial [Bacteroidaceae bacterium]
KTMRNHGYMKPPKHDGTTGGGIVTASLRDNSMENYLRVRKIIYTGSIKPSDVVYVRVKSVLKSTNTQFVMDWIELVPKSIYNGKDLEDKW